MLVLSRKESQSIKIGNVVIVVNQIRGNQVKLGIEAPQEVKILRSEMAPISKASDWLEPPADELNTERATAANRLVANSG